MASLEGRMRGAVVACLCCCAPVASAQTARSSAPTQYAILVGMVRDSAGNAIPGVEVRILGSDVGFARTDDAGGFRMTNLVAGPSSVKVRRMGFAPATVDVRLRPGRTDSLVVSLSAIATTLPGVLVEDEYEARSHRLLAGFWDRRSRGFGNYVTRDEIERRDPQEFVDIARMVPSIAVVSRAGRKVLRFNRGGAARDCPPQYFVDGMRIEAGMPDEFTPQDVEAVEFYSGPATLPPQFAPRPFSYTCGAIVIWTRIPGA
jgi:hypothetical protein